MCLEALEAAQRDGVEKFSASTTWLRLFLARHRLSLRAKTRQGQQSPADVEKVLAKFSSDIKCKMLQLGVRQLYNADQTAVFFEYLPKETINKYGEKTVWVRCSGKDKERATVMLMADVSGKKFPPSLIFHSRPSTVPDVSYENLALRHGFGKFVWREIDALQRETGMMIYGNATAWWNSTLSFDFLRQFFANRPPASDPAMLLWDEFSGHWTSDIQAYAMRIGCISLRSRRTRHRFASPLTSRGCDHLNGDCAAIGLSTYGRNFNSEILLYNSTWYRLVAQRWLPGLYRCRLSSLERRA